MLAEKLVEQGILSFDDLSVMEIVDLVNTIEDLNEELAIEIVGRAEVLAEEQADDMPRRKGARRPAGPRPTEAAAGEGEAAVNSGPAPTMEDLFRDGDQVGKRRRTPPEGPADADPADEPDPDRG